MDTYEIWRRAVDSHMRDLMSTPLDDVPETSYSLKKAYRSGMRPIKAAEELITAWDREYPRL